MLMLLGLAIHHVHGERSKQEVCARSDAENARNPV